MEPDTLDVEAQYHHEGSIPLVIAPKPYHDEPPSEEISDAVLSAGSLAVYHDDPLRQSESPEPQRYVSSASGYTSPLIVQATREAHNLQRSGIWRNNTISGNAVPELRLSTWVLGKPCPDSRVSVPKKALRLMRASFASPVFLILAATTFKKYWLPQHIPDRYPEFKGSFHDVLRRPQRILGAADSPGHEDDDESEQKRLVRPRKLIVKNGASWEVVDGDGDHVDKPYIFISYAANQFERIPDETGRLVLSDSASERLKARAEILVQENNVEAYWIDFLRTPHQPEATDDVHRFCDVVRGCEKVCILLGEDANMNRSLAMFGKRLWCLPECLLAPKHEVYVQGGGRSEIVSIIHLPQRSWMRSYTDDAGLVVEGRGDEEDFRLLAEHFSGLLTLSRLELFSVALRAMRALDYFPFERGDIAYCLMGLLRKRPKMVRTDSEEQALARLCLSNDNDRMLERMACMLPTEKDGSKGWIGKKDTFGANVWDIEPLCQIVSICDDEAVIIDGCCGIPIEWGQIPRIEFRGRLSPARARIMRFVLGSAYWWSITAFIAILSVIVLEITESILRSIFKIDRSSRTATYRLYNIMYHFVIGTLLPSLFFGYTAPFYLPLAYGDQVEEAQPFLVGLQGVLPIAELERLAFGNSTGRLRYATSARYLCSPDPLDQPDIAPALDVRRVPEGHVVFTLLNTGSMTVSIFSAPRPPTVALLCGQEGGMLRAVLCSYNESRNALRKETVLRMETTMVDHANKCGWLKLSL
ncbi:hypothetical protein PVAG01_05620 [Phlyctema vagabunda]|uniref:3-hydroxyisobutyrate dehydrogenase protein n=1 Tax=Phlyctema vagabunda TaxID=108571 RepID=A0ABR4PKK5_9HELO